MSYEQLAQHALQLEQSAIIMDLRQRGFGYDKGRLFHAGLSDAEVKAVVDLTAARFAGVAELFTPFLAMPEPAAFTSLEKVLAGVATTLNSGHGALPYNSASVLANLKLGAIDDVKALVKDWYGGAAMNFKDNFLSQWYPITSNQFALVMALKGAIEAEAALWTEARNNVDDLAHKAQASMDAMLDCNPKDVAFLLTVAGSIFAVGAVVASGGLEIGLTIVGESFASAGAFPMADAERVAFSGKNAAAIVAGVQGALTKLAAQIIEAENVIRDAMTTAIEVLSTNQDRIVAPRPQLADQTRATIRDVTVGLGLAEG